MTDSQLKEQFQAIEDNFNKAIISNNVAEIKKCISEDWVLVDAQGGIIPAERFISVVDNGLLSHSTMDKELLRVKVYGDIAIVTGRGQNTGMWQGQPISADEWITDIYRNENERWVCVMTHLTPVTKSDQRISILEISRAFSNGEFSKVYSHLAENIIWNVVEENEFVGKEAVIKNCEQVRQYFDSVSTDFKTVNVIEDKNKVMVNGTAEFLRDGNTISFVSACDIYEFNDQKQIVRITSYCIQKPK